MTDTREVNVSAANGDELKECRICKSDDEQTAMLSPCDCTGSIQFVHKNCLLDWVRSNQARRPWPEPVEPKHKCNVCNAEYKCRFVTKRVSFWVYLSQEYRQFLSMLGITMVITLIILAWSIFVLRMKLRTYCAVVSNRRMAYKRGPMSQISLVIFKFILCLENAAALAVLWTMFYLAVAEEWNKYVNLYYDD